MKTSILCMVFSLGLTPLCLAHHSGNTQRSLSTIPHTTVTYSSTGSSAAGIGTAASATGVPSIGGGNSVGNGSSTLGIGNAAGVGFGYYATGPGNPGGSNFGPQGIETETGNSNAPDQRANMADGRTHHDRDGGRASGFGGAEVVPSSVETPIDLSTNPNSSFIQDSDSAD